MQDDIDSMRVNHAIAMSGRGCENTLWAASHAKQTRACLQKFGDPGVAQLPPRLPYWSS
jgi:hypothetical protein